MFTINEVLWDLHESNYTAGAQATIVYNVFKKHTLEYFKISFRCQSGNTTRKCRQSLLSVMSLRSNGVKIHGPIHCFSRDLNLVNQHAYD